MMSKNYLGPGISSELLLLDVPHPKTVQEVRELTTNQLSWLRLSLMRNDNLEDYPSYKSLHLDIQTALYVALIDLHISGSTKSEEDRKFIPLKSYKEQSDAMTF